MEGEESTLRKLLLEEKLSPSNPLIMEDNYITTVETVKTERDVIIELLEMYRRLPCLWDSTHKFYNSKRARRRALEMLWDVWKQMDPNTSLAKVRKKLDNLRSAFYREWKKIEASKQAGLPEEEIHRPSLWYYPYLVFLRDRDSEGPKQVDSVPKERIVIMKRENHRENRVGRDSSNQTSERQSEWIETPTEAVFLSKSEIDGTIEVPVKRIKRAHSRRVDNHDSIEDSTDDFKRVDSQNLIESHNLIEDSTDAFARAMGLQLKEMTRMQRCIAEKLIAEVIFCGKLEQLTLKSSININN